MADKLHCCWIDCDRAAEWEIRTGDGIDDYTHACGTHVGELAEDGSRLLWIGETAATAAQARRNEIENAQHGMEKRGDARLAGDVLDPVKRMSIGELRRDALDYRDRHGEACVHELAQRLDRTEADLAAARAEAERLWDELAACKHERDCAVSSICERLAQAEADARRVNEQIAVMQPVYEAVQEIPLGSDGRFWEFVCRSLMETGEEGAAIAAESIRGWINKLESACGQALAESEGGAG